MSEKIRVLFLCTHNSCRSQMAEGWARALRAKDLEAFSAGTEPSRVDPVALKVMAEAGVDISGQRSKSLDEFRGEPFDYVITLCGSARETCPVFPGAGRVVHHGFDDPPALARDDASAEESLLSYRRVRDEIRAFVLGIPENLEEQPAGLGQFILSGGEKS